MSVTMIIKLPTKRRQAISQWQTFLRVFNPQDGGENQLA